MNLHYCLMHSWRMDGKQLLNALMERAGTNPHQLGKLLGNSSLQSQLQRFLSGATASPRWSTLEPVAAHFGVGVQAFFDNDLAAAVAIERGLGSDLPAARSDTAPYNVQPSVGAPIPIRAPLPSGVGSLIVALGSALQPHDRSARKAIASLLEDLAMHPEDAPLIGDRVERLLGTSGNAPPQKSIISQ